MRLIINVLLIPVIILFGSLSAQDEETLIGTLEAVNWDENGNVNAITDAGSAGALAVAAITAAGMNVRINALAVSDQAASEGWIKELENLEKAAMSDYAGMKQIISQRGNIAFM